MNRIERYLDQLIGGLNDMVERALQKHRLNPKTLDSNESTRKTDANWHQALEPGISIWGEQAIPPCPICGVNPHNGGIHEEWRRLPGAKSKEKLAADREAYPAHEITKLQQNDNFRAKAQITSVISLIRKT